MNKKITKFAISYTPCCPSCGACDGAASYYKGYWSCFVCGHKWQG